MKFNKIFTLALSLFVATAAFAGGADKSAPTQGDMSVAFSLDPLATFAGNLLNGTMNNALEDLAGEPLLLQHLPKSVVSIMGNYMLTDNLAARVNIGFGFSYMQKNHYVIDDAAFALNELSNAKVIDQITSKTLSGSFALGVEYRLGQRAVQGVFGGGLSYACGTASNAYAYGNAISQLNQNPSQSVEMPAPEQVTGYLPNARILSTNATDLIHMAGIYGSVGVEWFVAPAIALGANVNLGIYYEINPMQASVYEGWNTITEKVDTHTELVAPASHGFHFGTDNIGANLYIAFYFGTN